MQHHMRLAERLFNELKHDAKEIECRIYGEKRIMIVILFRLYIV